MSEQKLMEVQDARIKPHQYFPRPQIILTPRDKPTAVDSGYFGLSSAGPYPPSSPRGNFFPAFAE